MAKYISKKDYQKGYLIFICDILSMTELSKQFALAFNFNATIQNKYMYR
ncbi:hypothetical protein [Candidatus Proelusimicrobium volucris]